MKDEKNDIVKELMPRYLAGETTSVEEKRLLDWIAEAKENKHEYIALKKIFDLSQKHYASQINDNLDLNIDHEWNHFIKQIDTKEQIPIRAIQSAQRSISVWYKVAATILLIMVSGFIINYFISTDREVLYQTTSATLAVSLPDGSHVSLNRNSKLSYLPDFDDEKRSVVLHGEAFFDVVPNANKPFVIHVNDAVVEVVGTSFNIQASQVNNDIEVIVKSGVVKLTVPDLKKEIKLNAGKKATYVESQHKLDSGNNHNINFLSWNTQKIVFEETDLYTVIETLNKTYGVNIKLNMVNVPSSCVVTVTFDHQTLESVLRVLENTLNLKYTVQANQIEITSAGC